MLRAADELHVDSFIADASWKTLSARYDVPQMIDTIDTVAETTMYAGVFNSLGVQIEAGIVDRLPSGIPYAVSAKRTNLRVFRTPRIPPSEAPAGGRGGGANVFRTFNRHPPADRVRGAINTHVNSSSTLTPRRRELLMTRIGVFCRSEYEYAAHLRLGRQAGFTDADVARVINGPDSGPGDPLETALLQAADDLYENDVVSAATWATLAKSLNERQMLDVVISVGRLSIGFDADQHRRRAARRQHGRLPFSPSDAAALIVIAGTMWRRYAESAILFGAGGSALTYPEQRRHPRLPVLVDCRIEGASGRSEMRLTNLSATGCFVDTAMSFPAGDARHRVRHARRVPRSRSLAEWYRCQQGQDSVLPSTSNKMEESSRQRFEAYIKARSQ